MAFSEWKKHQNLQDSPALACPAPLICPAPTRAVIWPELASSPQPQPVSRPAFRPIGLTSTGPSAFSVVPPGSHHPPPPPPIPLEPPSTVPSVVNLIATATPTTVPTNANASAAAVAAATAAAAAALLSNGTLNFGPRLLGGNVFGTNPVINGSGTNRFLTVPVPVAGNPSPSIYSSLMCLPNLLEKLQSQNILRSHMSAASYKPIPNNEKVDLGRFRVKDPNEWLVEDVVSWMLDMAKRHNIPFEDLNMHKFSGLSGPDMVMLTEENFVERDPNYGKLIFDELHKTLSYAENTLIDDYMKNHPEEETVTIHSPSTSADLAAINIQPMLRPTTNVFQSHQLSSLPVMQQLTLNNLSQAISQATFNQNLLNPHAVHSVNMANAVQTLNQSLASSLAAGLTTSLSPMSLSIIQQNGFSPASPLINSQLMQPKISPISNETIKYNPGSVSTDYEDERATSSDLKIRKNKDGKPRKRSQHTKGNKLWEFIRDALKDPSTCPSVVRWEDPIEGVFRIVESEKLAKLWGERKNNTKMTYEKLSRAMRTYYEKQILVPVPKTGLYPKKLVYKFGPGAHGWEMIKQERV